MAISLDQSQDKIDAAQSALADSTKLYDEGKRQYEVVTALYSQAKVSASQAKLFFDTLNNSQYTPIQALQLASAYASNASEYASSIQGRNADEVLNAQKTTAAKKLSVADIAVKKAEQEVQKTEKYLKGIEAQIVNIKNQLSIVTKKNLKQVAKEQTAISNSKITRNRAKVTSNGVKAKIRQNKGVIKSVAKSAILFTVAYLLNNKLKELSTTVQQLTALVDKTNDIIASAQTKQDILKSKVARDAALIELNKAYSQIAILKQYLDILQILLTVFNLVLSLVLLFPFPITAKIAEQITKAILTIDALVIIIAIISASLESLLAEVELQKSRLLPLNDLIDQAINDNLSPQDIRALLNRSNLGLLEGTTYKGFRFSIYEENDPKFVVAGNKRRYAVALDRSGFIVLQSQPSFTLDPNVLVEELKLIIDERNLEP
jgi:hypothetical protein